MHATPAYTPRHTHPTLPICQGMQLIFFNMMRSNTQMHARAKHDPWVTSMVHYYKPLGEGSGGTTWKF